MRVSQTIPTSATSMAQVASSWATCFVTRPFARYVLATDALRPVTSMKVSGSKIRRMDMESRYGITEPSMKDNGKTTYHMELVSTPSPMETP